MLRSILSVSALLCSVLVAPSHAEDWPQFRGPRRDGHVEGFANPTAWPNELTRVWTIKVGQGHSSPIIAGGRAFVLTRQGDQEWTQCIELSTGKVVWTDRVAAPFDSVIFPAQRLGKSPRSTPVWYAGKLYTIGVNGLVTCLNATDGKVVWRRDFSKSFKVPMPICGASLTPLIDGKKLYLHVGHDDKGAFLALNRETGATLWSSEGEGPAYSSPVLATIGGERQIVTAAHSSWMGIDPATGRRLWSVPNRQNFFNHNSITPVVAGDLVICGANQRPTIALKVTKKGAAWSADKVWDARDVTMSTSSPVLSGDHVYSVSEKRRGQIVDLDVWTGKTVWSCPGNKGEHVTLFDTGPYVLAASVNGELFVYRKASTGLTELARYEVADGATWASPAISGKLLLAKGAESLTLWRIPSP